MSDSRVLVLTGSLRSNSNSAALAESISRIVDGSVTVDTYSDLAAVPFYNPDEDAENLPAAVTNLRAQAADADAVVLITPEYNGAAPAVISNAIDWLSRPYGSGALKDKPVAVISSSPSPNGGQWANEDAVRGVTIAGGVVKEGATAIIRGFDATALETHPAENPEVADAIRTALSTVLTK